MRLSSLSRLGLAAMLALIAAGCSNNKDKLEDTKWFSEGEIVKGEEEPPGARILQFGQDGHLLYIVAGRGYKGNYTLGMGQAVTFTLDDELNGRKIHPHKIVIEGEKLTLMSADGSELRFHKSEEKKKKASE